jgi:hypothetical protein
LRSKARYDRWMEELAIVQSEMTWTVNYFEYQKVIWEKRADISRNLGQEGHTAYALKQAAMWEKFATEGTKKFDGLMK